jgi:hypothetical protein
MRTLVLALVAALCATAAHAHSSVVPHQHPHGSSMLPDALALALAAFFVALGLVALRRMRKE